MAAYTDFLREINVVIPGVARPIVTPVIEQVVRGFCERSGAWRHVVELDVDTSMADAPIDVATLFDDDFAQLSGELVDVKGLQLAGVNLSTDDFTKIARRGFSFNAKRPSPGLYTITVSLKPVLNATAIPDFLVNHWDVTIAYGVAYRLAMQPNKAWSNPHVAQEYKRLFEEGQNQAMFEANNERQSMRGGNYIFY